MTKKLPDEAVGKLIAGWMTGWTVQATPLGVHVVNDRTGVEYLLTDSLDDIALVEQNLIAEGHGQRLEVHLGRICFVEHAMANPVFATARQRAEACARTIMEIGGK